MSDLEINPNKEYVLAGDVSGSMATVDAKCGGNTRYDYMLEKFKLFIQTASDYDEHGSPTIILFGENAHVYEHVNLDDIKSKLDNFQPEGFTNLHLAIEEAYSLHREDKSELAKNREVHPGTQLLVFTDGAPSNMPAVERILVKIVSEIDREDEFQINFLTVGTIEPKLQTWLESLHDELENPKINPRDFDIIHVSKLEETSFMGALKSNLHEEKVA